MRTGGFWQGTLLRLLGPSPVLELEGKWKWRREDERHDGAVVVDGVKEAFFSTTVSR